MEAETNNRLKVNSIPSKYHTKQINVGFGNSPRKNERYEYVRANPGAASQPPGIYSQDDNAPRRLSHNKSQKRVFINQSKRFSDHLEHGSPARNNPGPGAYLDKDDLDLQGYQGMLLLQNNSTLHGQHQSQESLPTLPKLALKNTQSHSQLKLRKNMQSVLSNASKLHLINDKTILDTKRGKNNPSHVFMKPRCTQDPSR